MSVCLICTIGVPGSGKTTLAQTLAKFSGTRTSIKYVHVSFDELQFLSQSFGAENSSLLEEGAVLTSYKLFRHVMVRLVEAVILYIKLGADLVIPEVLNTSNACQLITSQTADLTSSDDVCIIVDDIMYYRSMRYPYYQLARKWFGEVYVNTPLAVCVSRNKDRPIDKRIDENTICKISQRLEAPDPTAHSWEIYNIDSGTASVADLMSFTKMCLTNPVEASSHVTNSLETEKSMQISAEDVSHQADLICRQLVKLYITSSAPSDVKGAAVRANKCRKLVLAHLKSQANELSDALSTQTLTPHSAQDSHSPLYEFVQRIFSQHLDLC
ncbi:hypothetical protein EB796_022016 [Bugula neritina]|uniref:PSTK n=1 Tax=Bugula neritina TaxID=10212 RepID=A0A7J7J0K8_BUGNE|nr:hypothetical protein EB796_022016 [Bugula neritina]